MQSIQVPFLILLLFTNAVAPSTSFRSGGLGKCLGSSLVLVAESIILNSLAVATIRGVAPEHANKYAPLIDDDGLQLFVCLHRFNSTAPKQRVPIIAVNDGYCDCHDGSDEPGTEACAGQMQTLFYCPNLQSLPMYVYSSRVNDGICDCCDASDEWRSKTLCVNNCVEEGRIIRQSQERKIIEMQGGIHERRKLIERMQVALQRNRKELERARREVQKIEAQSAVGATNVLTTTLDVTASQEKAIATLVVIAMALFIPCCVLFKRYRCCRSRVKTLTRVEILKRIELLVQVPIAYVKDDFETRETRALGLGTETNSLGGLTITSVEPSGLISDWNSKQIEQVEHVRAGDRIIELACKYSEGEELVIETAGEMQQALLNHRLQGLDLLVSASRAEAEVMVLCGPVTIHCLDLKTDVELREVEDGKAGMEVVSVGPRVEDWNRQMQELGACLTQTIEAGDRLVYDTFKGIASNTAIINAKLRYPNQFCIDSFEVVVERKNEDDKLGLQLQESESNHNGMVVFAVLATGLISQHNALPGVRQVLPGDHMISANGKEEYNDLLLEFRERCIVLRLERYANVSGKTTHTLSGAAQVATQHIKPRIVPPRSSPKHAIAAGSSRMRRALLSLCLAVVSCMGLVAVNWWIRKVGPASGSQASQIDVVDGKNIDQATAVGEGPVVSEYAKWMEGANDGGSPAEDAMPIEVPLASATQDTDHSSVAESGEDFVRSLWHDSYHWCIDVWSAARGEVKSVADRQEIKLSRARARVSEIDDRISKIHDGGDDALAFHVLEDKCMSAKHTAYTYEICFFKHAKQDSMNIGHWRRWEAPNIALFDGGTQCHAGPKRSLRVIINCGAKEQISDVEEPSRCAYKATMTHPLACSEKALEELTDWRGPRMPYTHEL